jgi:hypothetical protein
LANLGVLLDPVDTFNDQFVSFGVDVNDFALNSAILARNYQDRVTFANS